MKYIIDIDDTPYESNGRTLWKASAFSTLVFDHFGMIRLEQYQEHDGCDGCRYEYLPPGQEPCESCCWNYTSSFEPKTEEIQAGDEVVHDGSGEGERGIVIEKEYDEDKGRVWLRVLRNQKAKYSFWSETLCHRTGKSFPEFIKALEQLPKDGE